MRILANKDEITKAQYEFKETVAKAASKQIETKIGYPSGNRKASVHWVPSVELWAHFGLPSDEKSPGQRYWNVFGLEKPAASVSIMCEINPPFQDINRRTGGAFGQVGENLYILHRGNFNAYRGKIPHDFIRKNFYGNWCSACDGDRDLLVVGKLPDLRFVEDLRKFVAEAARVRKLYKAR